MKSFFFLMLAALTGAFVANAQEEETKLTIPSSPAFSILNFEPTSVLRPTTNKDVAADVLNAFDQNGKLVVNLGLEVTPYWLQSRPTLTRAQYLNPDLGQLIKQSLSLSAATVKDSASGDTKLGTGFRFKLYNGKPVAALPVAEQKLIQQLTITTQAATVRAQIKAGAITTIKAAIDKFINLVQSDPNGGIPTPQNELDALRIMAENISKEFDDNSLLAFMVKLTDEQVASYDGLADQVEELTYQRTGWIVEVAGATAFNTSHDNDLERAGVWANASNYISASDLISMTGRYQWRNNDTNISNFDLGISYLKQTSKYNVSLEAMLRWYSTEVPDFNLGGEPIKRSEKDFTYRIAVQGSYIISNDISINLSLGKDFSSPLVSATSFFSILGFNYSIFNNERIRL